MCKHVCFILPGHVLRRIAENHPDEDQRTKAMQTIAASARIRGRRDVIGPIARHYGLVAGTKQRLVYDAAGIEMAPGNRLVRSESQPDVKDPAVNEAYDSAGITYDAYLQIFKRNSIDNRGMRLDSTVHYGRGYDNAFWDGRQMVYGDGDGRIFNRFTVSIDVIAHELTHGVTQHEANLDYAGQSGALNESISDIMGTIVKQWKLKQSFQQADWLIGAGLLAPGINGQGLRSLKAPGTAYDDPILGRDPQPAHMNGFMDIQDDEGGVHINSGIPNHWFYLMCQQLDVNSWEDPGQIVYGALCIASHTTGFSEWAGLTIQIATQLFGARSRQVNACRKAWSGVGISI